MHDFNAAQHRAIAALADPNRTGSLEDLARRLRIHRNTLANWRKLPGFRESVVRETLSHIEVDLAPIFSALVSKAREGDVAASRLIFQACGLLDRETRIFLGLEESTGEGAVPGVITVEEVTERLRKFHKWIAGGSDPVLAERLALAGLPGGPPERQITLEDRLDATVPGWQEMGPEVEEDPEG